MAEIVIFGGTTEGRKLAEVCAAMQISACVCVVSDYGEQLLPESEYLKICVGALEPQEMSELLRKESPLLVFDATHPYAAKVSSQAAELCKELNLIYQRVLRGELFAGHQEDEIWVDSIDEAVKVLEQDDRPVLVTTGSKDLAKYCRLPNYKERIYARVLASHEGIRAGEAIGLKGSHIIAMQGPFGQPFNEALLQQIGAGWLVTKESGSQGGFLEKLAAARTMKVKAVIVGRPVKETGVSLEEACRMAVELKQPEQSVVQERELVLIGIGMGSPELMTVEAVAAIRSCEALLGAPRMVAAAKHWNEHAETGFIYHPELVRNWLEERPWLRKAGILLSGDTGFYSGAKALKQEFLQKAHWRLQMLPGISTVSYLCARIGTSWEDIYLCSRHGRDCDLMEAISTYPRVFCLMGGAHPVQELCCQLAAKQNVKLTVGEWLSYPRERIVSGTPKQIGDMDFSGFCAVLIERNDDEG